MLPDPGPDGLAPEVEDALFAHQILDLGADFCPKCEQTTAQGRYCAHCGNPLFDSRRDPEVGRKPRACPADDCGAVTRNVFCSQCGAQVVPDDVLAVERGKKTWAELFTECDSLWERLRAKQAEPEREVISKWLG